MSCASLAAELANNSGYGVRMSATASMFHNKHRREAAKGISVTYIECSQRLRSYVGETSTEGTFGEKAGGHLIKVIGAAGNLEQSQEPVKVQHVRICSKQPMGARPECSVAPMKHGRRRCLPHTCGLCRQAGRQADSARATFDSAKKPL